MQHMRYGTAPNCIALHKIDMILVLSVGSPIEGISASVIQIDVPAICRARKGSHLISPRFEGCMYMANSTDPFSASIIPFEVPEQMRAFAEKGVLQARDSYAKFKDVAETNNGTIEAVFASASKGASAYSAKLMEIMKANTSATLDFAQELIGVKSPAEALELWTTHAKKQFEAFTAYSKELAELSQKVATETVEPIKTSASKLFKPAA
jgi:phasin